jgi:hypothetical protein
MLRVSTLRASCAALAGSASLTAAARGRAGLVLVDGDPLEDIRLTRATVRAFESGYAVSRSTPGSAP